MQFLQNSHSTLNSASEVVIMKEKFLIVFNNSKQADYWMRQFVYKFQNELTKVDRFKHTVEFDDSIFYFYGQLFVDRLKLDRTIKPDFVYNQEAICIMLDDVERYR